MKTLLGGLLIATGAVVLAAGALLGMGLLLQSPKRRRRARVDLDLTPAITEAPAKTPVSAASARNFSIKRTKSEVGYVYWILEGYGQYKCFVLCDSWEDAVAQAKARLSEVDSLHNSHQLVTT